jgi:hypothetical protein
MASATSDATISALSTEYIQVNIQAIVAGEPYNPTADAVSFAFTYGTSAPVTFYTGSWTTTAQGMYLAQCLIGPQNGGVVLAQGSYTVWIKISDDPEVPIRPVGTLTIT